MKMIDLVEGLTASSPEYMIVVLAHANGHGAATTSFGIQSEQVWIGPPAG